MNEAVIAGNVVFRKSPHHVVLARRAQLVRDLTVALQLVKRIDAPDHPSFVGFIAGPSRTGDIERILVHGRTVRKGWRRFAGNSLTTA